VIATKDFGSKLVLVTGAASGIGRATALRFSEEGADLILVDVNEEGLEGAALDIESRGRKAFLYRTDLSDAAQVEALHRRVTDEVGTPDVLMNAAGVVVVTCIEEAGLEDWRWTFDTNLWGYIYMIHRFLPDMIRRCSGHVVNVASGAGLFAVPYQAPYNTSKHAVVGLTESIRQEMARYGIGASVVCPGMIRTPIIDTARVIGFKDSAQKMAQRAASPPERMADEIIRGVRKNMAVIMYPPYVNMLFGLKRFSPRSADLLSKGAARAFYRLHRMR
jgi:NAD(P)-dependent dehydrogenase (short-subunit alcohol dehydrogenase family)